MSPLAPQSFSVQLHLAETNEIFSLPRCQSDLTLKKLKSHLELLTGIPLHLQRLQYLDEADLPDESTFQDNDIVPGGTITMHIWRQDGWGRLVAAAAKGETLKVEEIIQCVNKASSLVIWKHHEKIEVVCSGCCGMAVTKYHQIVEDHDGAAYETSRCYLAHRGVIDATCKHPQLQLARLGVTEDAAGFTPHAELLGAEQRKEWRAHRAFVALFVASHRGHAETVEFLLRHGADLHTQTPLGRTALHVAAVAGRCDCLELLLSYGAQALGRDSEGQTGLSLARQWGQKQSECTMVHFQCRKRSPGTAPPPSAAGRALQQPSGPTS